MLLNDYIFEVISKISEVVQDTISIEFNIGVVYSYDAESKTNKIMVSHDSPNRIRFSATIKRK
ncbi:hypothetical protein UFOVP97_4 [uncultured Caudovirales phage]|uniref:Uncharacterized protein n=1 Tax=uncultured Caudovirales phage TaxID=2100421 RepID=A0A6J5L228_9CAUD|nr:hypothetical protein UFOVP97_4 [uncultured Caudovirales phage]CAB4134147.1 hypothetical protein UFOVP268_22 [uncultured Caudovirales phage]